MKCICAVFLALEDEEGKNNDGISFSSSTGPAWAGSERDYTYDEVGLFSAYTSILHYEKIKLCNVKMQLFSFILIEDSLNFFLQLRNTHGFVQWDWCFTFALYFSLIKRKISRFYLSMRWRPGFNRAAFFISSWTESLTSCERRTQTW